MATTDKIYRVNENLAEGETHTQKKEIKWFCKNRVPAIQKVRSKEKKRKIFLYLLLQNQSESQKFL